MRLFDKRTPLQKEWEKLEVQEQRFLQKRSEKRESILNQKLEEKIPPKLQKTLDTAFAKAFALIFSFPAPSAVRGLFSAACIARINELYSLQIFTLERTLP